MNRWALTAIALTLLLLFPSGAFACVCVYKSPCESLKEARAVFSAKVVGVRDVEVVVEVERIWKGEPPESFRLYAGSRSDTCNFRFERGEKYLIYALEHDGGANGPVLKASKCLGTKKLKHAEKDLREFDSGRNP